MAAASRRPRDRQSNYACADDKNLHVFNLHGFQPGRVYCNRKSGVRGSVMAQDTDKVVRVCGKAEVAPGAVKAFVVGPAMLAVYNIDGTYYVTDDECTHAAASLADGILEGDVIECCMHMGSFNVVTGEPVAPPCEVPLRTYQVVLKGEDVFADLSRNAVGEQV